MRLPTLGLGLSSNAQTSDVPRPYALLDLEPALFDYVEYSAPLDVAEARRDASLFATMESRRATTPLLYHPVHLNLWGPELESEERLRLLDAHATAVGSPWVSNDVGWWHHGGVPFPGYLYVSPTLDGEGLARAVEHVLHVRKALTVPLLIENPVVMTPRGSMHVAEFMTKLHEATGCPLLLDVGHLVSHQLARGLSLLEGLDALPWNSVAQLHIAGGVISGKFYADDHTQPIRDEVWTTFDEVRKRCTQLCAVTYEGDGHPEPVALRTLKRLRPTITRGSEQELPSPSGKGVGVENQPSLWELFRALHKEDGDELQYRLAVLADQLDAEVPLARLAVTPTLQSLREFIASDHFENHFKSGRALADAFLTWAAMKARALPGADALVSLEIWARTTARSKTEATFAVDLTEALHAATALKRHLRARELISAEAWEGLLHCARRAPPRAWKVKLTVTPRGVRISEA